MKREKAMNQQRIPRGKALILLSMIFGLLHYDADFRNRPLMSWSWLQGCDEGNLVYP